VLKTLQLQASCAPTPLRRTEAPAASRSWLPAASRRRARTHLSKPARPILVARSVLEHAIRRRAPALSLSQLVATSLVAHSASPIKSVRPSSTINARRSPRPLAQPHPAAPPRLVAAWPVDAPFTTTRTAATTIQHASSETTVLAARSYAGSHLKVIASHWAAASCAFGIKRLQLARCPLA